jgi:hypothetical protein
MDKNNKNKEDIVLSVNENEFKATLQKILQSSPSSKKKKKKTTKPR